MLRCDHLAESYTQECFSVVLFIIILYDGVIFLVKSVSSLILFSIEEVKKPNVLLLSHSFMHYVVPLPGKISYNF